MIKAICFSVAGVARVAEAAKTAAKTQKVVAEGGGGKHNTRDYVLDSAGRFLLDMNNS